jgi:L-amino acid N-acyltransferase YncA
VTPEDIVVRPAGQGDREALEAFACSRGLWYEDEVERYIRGRAFAEFERVDGYELLVAEEDSRLIGVMAYVPELARAEEADWILIVRLQVLAIALEDQRRVLESGRRLSDALLQTLIAQAVEYSVGGALTAIVARDNVRSINLCERNGIDSQFAHGSRYVLMSGTFGDEPLSLG